MTLLTYSCTWYQQESCAAKISFSGSNKPGTYEEVYWTARLHRTALKCGHFKRGDFSSAVASVTKLQASHYAPTDIPIILEGSRAGSVARMLGVTGAACNYLHFSFQPSLLAGVPGPTSNLAYLTITSDLVRSWVRGSTREGWEELLADVRGAGDAVQVGMQDQ